MVNRNLLRQYDLSDAELDNELAEAFSRPETGGDVEVVQKLALKLLGKQFKSNSIEEVNMWVQLLVDIRYLLRKEEVVLNFLLSHFKW